MSIGHVSYFSDVSCIWAYATQARVDAVKDKFGDRVRLEYRFCTDFDDSGRKIAVTWRDKGEYAGFNSHSRNVAQQLSHIEVHPEIWLLTCPPTLASAHLFFDGRAALATRARR